MVGVFAIPWGFFISFFLGACFFLDKRVCLFVESDFDSPD